MDLNPNSSDSRNVPSTALPIQNLNDVIAYRRVNDSKASTRNNTSLHRRSASTTDFSQHSTQLQECFSTSIPEYGNNSRCSINTTEPTNIKNIPKKQPHQIHTSIPPIEKNIFLHNNRSFVVDNNFDNPMHTPSSFRRTHTRHLSLDMLPDNNSPLLNNSSHDRNISLNRSIPTLELDDSNNLHNCTNSLDQSVPIDMDMDMDLDHNTDITLTDNALLCLKTLASPIAIFPHIGRFAFASISTTFSFAMAFAISDLLFFSFLDKFDLSYIRYVLLGVTGIVAAFSIKGVVSSVINILLSVAKGTYSWYFSLIDPQCSFCDFLLGINEMTMDNS